MSVRVVDRELVELVDAIAEAIDPDHTDVVGRVSSALEPFGGSELLAAELRLAVFRGRPLFRDRDCICRDLNPLESSEETVNEGAI